MMNYRCDSCGCYLDPGEGNQCDECRQMAVTRSRQQRRLMAFLKMDDAGQYEIQMEGNIYAGR